MLYDAAVLATIILVVVSAVDYVHRAWIGQTKPVPATWILMNVVIGLSLWMYWHTPRRSWTANISLVSASANIVIILIGVIAANIRYGTLRIAFDRVQKWCLAGGAMVVAFWFFTDRPLTSYVLVQCIALIAYFATVKRLWRAERSTEPLFIWVAMFLACLCSMYPAWVRSDVYSWIYLVRAVPSTAGVIYLIVRIKRKSQASVA